MDFPFTVHSARSLLDMLLLHRTLSWGFLAIGPDRMLLSDAAQRRPHVAVGEVTLAEEGGGAQGVTVLTGAVTASCRKFSAKYARIYSREADSAQDFPRLPTELCHLLAAAAPDNLWRGARAYFCSAPSCNSCRCSWTTRSLNAPWFLKVACYNNVLGWYWHKWLWLATDTFIWCSAGRCLTVLAASNI